MIADKYVVERVLGVGGMGVVVAARHRLLGGRVALKFILPELVHGTEAVQRFLREARSATQITSEHVARVADVGVLDNGAPYMVMEYLDGQDLGSVLAERGPLAVSQVADYVLQALQAVAEAHAKGIVHRDLKPSNLFLTRRADGTPLVKVLDFGIAKAVVLDSTEPRSAAGNSRDATGVLTGTTGVVGSPRYMSPEQIRSARHVDARSDVWAVGILLHELLSQRHPFPDQSAGAVLAAIAADLPIRLRAHRANAPPALEELIVDCLQKDRARRVQSVADVAERLAPFGTEDGLLSLSRIRGVAGRRRAARVAPSDGPSSGAASDAATTRATWAETAGETALGSSRRLALGAAVSALVLAGGAFALFRSSGNVVVAGIHSATARSASVLTAQLSSATSVIPAVLDVPVPPAPVPSASATLPPHTTTASTKTRPPRSTTVATPPPSPTSTASAPPVPEKVDVLKALTEERR